ncbi:MAG: sugar phosphate isomerase/epimerase [Dehalococcoidia bacterium]|nr:sugar phosphate isomerase/epimerase [Dehalococcoidia bacterium]
MSNLGFHCHSLDTLEETIVDNGLQRGEFYHLLHHDLARLEQIIRFHSLRWSVHAPLVQLDWYPRPPTWSFLCDRDREKKALTLKMITYTVEQAEHMGADYVVVHFPSPANEAPGKDKARIESIARDSCDRLAALSVKRNMPLHIEGVGSSPLIDAEFLTGILREFTPLRFCLDIAHSYLASKENEFELYEFAARLLPHTGSVHLWNTRSREDYMTYRHVPVHPSQDPEEGWIDVARILKVLADSIRSIPIICESENSFPQALGNHDYREGVRWVKEILRTLS